jgi:superfamily II DNA or RNA helicase
VEGILSGYVMTILNVEKINEAQIRVYSDDMGAEGELVDYFTYEYPGAKFTPKFKARIWDGKVRLYDGIRKTLRLGLYEYVLKFAETRGYEINLINDVSVDNGFTYEQIELFAQTLNLHGGGKPIEIRDYQIDAIHTGLNYNRRTLLSPTGSGKSLIIYTTCRWHLNAGRKVIVVVPTTSLVEQMYSDFADYSSHNGWNTDDHCQKLYSGFSKTFESDILFTTWQSIYKLPKQWFDQFDVVIGDEAHQFKATSLTSIMDKMTETKYRIGTTGSLDDKKVNRLVLEGVFGPVYRVTTTHKLQKEGKLAPLKITALLLKYPESVRKANAKIEYKAELDLIVRDESRCKFIRNLALNCEGNTLLLFQFVEKHGAVLYDMIKAKAGDRNVYFIHGDTDVDDRERIRKVLSTEKNAIVVASFGTSATGINIPSIENIIFASPSKSVIRVLQSIGRGLRLNSGKTHCNLYDLTDDLHWKGWKNHTLKHGAERYKIYAAEEFPLKLVEVNL